MASSPSSSPNPKSHPSPLNPIPNPKSPTPPPSPNSRNPNFSAPPPPSPYQASSSNPNPSTPRSQSPKPPIILAKLQPVHRPPPSPTAHKRVATRGRVLINVSPRDEEWTALPTLKQKIDLVSNPPRESGSSTFKMLGQVMKMEGKKLIADASKAFKKAPAINKGKGKREASPGTPEPPLTKQEEMELRAEYVMGMGPLQVERMFNLIFVPNCVPIHEDMKKVVEVVTEEDWYIANELGKFYHLL